MSKFLMLILAGSLLSGCGDRQAAPEYVPLQEVYPNFDADDGTYIFKPVPAGNVANVEIALDYYHLPHRREGASTVLVRAQDFQDRDLMWNITTKSHDQHQLAEMKKDLAEDKARHEAAIKQVERLLHKKDAR